MKTPPVRDILLSIGVSEPLADLLKSPASAAASIKKPEIVGGKGGIGPEYETRRGLPEDVNCIYATWLRCYKHSSAFARRIPDRVFYEQHHAVVGRLLARAEVLVVTPRGEPGVILGYSVTEPSVIHFVYVKKPFRRMGIATALLVHLDPNACVFTHWTEGWDFLHRKWPNAQYNPYML